MSQIIISDEALHWKEVAHRVAEEVIRPAAQHYDEVERMYRDAKFFTAGKGTSEIQRLVISRRILKEAA